MGSQLCTTTRTRARSTSANNIGRLWGGLETLPLSSGKSRNSRNNRHTRWGECCGCGGCCGFQR